MATVQTTMTHVTLAAYRSDRLLKIPCNLCAFFEFHGASERIDYGYRRAEEALECYERHAQINESDSETRTGVFRLVYWGCLLMSSNGYFKAYADNNGTYLYLYMSEK
jgi:hypothetical protein